MRLACRSLLLGSVVLLVAALGGACSSDVRPDAGADLAVRRDLAVTPADQAVSEDLATAPDLAPPPEDLWSPTVDLAEYACADERDCRLFSDYCNTPGRSCTCKALHANDPDPPCFSGMVTCFVEPCFNKTVRCNPTSFRCELQ